MSVQVFVVELLEGCNLEFIFAVYRVTSGQAIGRGPLDSIFDHRPWLLTKVKPAGSTYVEFNTSTGQIPNFMLATHPSQEEEVGTIPYASLPLYLLQFLGCVHVESEHSPFPCSHADGGAHAAFLLGMIGMLRQIRSMYHSAYIIFPHVEKWEHVCEDKRLPPGVPQRLTISGVAWTFPFCTLFMYLSILMPASREPRR